MRRHFLLASVTLAALASIAISQEKPVVCGPAGTYTVEAPTSATITYGQGFVTISWSPTPAVDPVVPTPDPKPDPDTTIPKTERLYLVAFYDLNKLTLELAKARNSQALRDLEASQNVEYRVVSTSSTTFTRYSEYLTQRSVKPPCYVVQRTDGTAIEAAAFADEATLLSAVKRWRGTP